MILLHVSPAAWASSAPVVAADKHAVSHKPRWMRLPAPSQSACVLPVFSMQALELARHVLLGSTRTSWEVPSARIVQLAPSQAKARRPASSVTQDALPLQGLELATHVQRVAIR